MVRTIFNRAIREEIVSRDLYPFGGKDRIQVKQVETHKVGLNQDEITELENVKLEEGSEFWHCAQCLYSLFQFCRRAYQ